jgi:hypothetical protein
VVTALAASVLAATALAASAALMARGWWRGRRVAFGLRHLEAFDHHLLER